MFEMTLLGK